jgi:hypothetical protein
MAQNRVEYHIQDGAIFTFKVAVGQTIRIGQLVELTGDREVSLPTGLSTKLVGVVYGGTVGIDGVNDGFKGDNGDVVSVVVLKPFVYLEAGEAITAGALLSSGANGVAMTTGATNANKIGMAIQGASAGERFVAILG